MKTQFEELKENDLEIIRIKKEAELKLNNLGISYGKQLDSIRQGKPIPVLKPIGIKQFQNTTEQQRRQQEKTAIQKKEILERAKIAELKRERELAEIHPNEYKEYLKKQRQLKAMEKMKENFKDKDRER
ncbi:MAG: hypothetical protein JXR03_06520 [Cyclobacteriaceae bacterium]